MANFTSFTSAPLSFVDNGVAAQALPIYGTSGTITNLSISLLGLTHTFPDDLDILLVAPNGKRNILFMSDAGGDPNIGSVDLTFSDAFSSALPNESQIVSGNYRPTDFEPVETDADFLTATGGINSGSATTFAAAFNSFAANGDWRLYVRDDVQSDVGSLASWGLTISTSSSQARVTGTSGADNLEISSDDGSSGYFVLSSGGGGMFFSDVASWDISGGAGPDTISFRSNFTNSYVFDLTNGNLTSIEVLQFLNPGTNGSATVRIGASEIGAGFATNGTILGNSDLNIADTLDIVMGSDTNVDLSTIIFNFFDGSRDKVTVTGDGSSETIIGTNLHDVIVGNGGNDHISSRGGDDFIEGGAGGDHIDGGTNGADGDTASYANSAAGVNVQLQYGVFAGGDAAGDSLTGIENLTGSSKADTLYGNSGANFIRGGDGGDHIKGLGGADRLVGEGGDDWIYAEASDTVASGGPGFDRLFVTSAAGFSIEVDTFGFEVATGNIGNDSFFGQIATVGLTMHGQSGNDSLHGGSGDDYIYGDYGADQLFGGAGLDRLYIDADDTVIDAGPGLADRLIVTGKAAVSIVMATANAEVAYGNAGNDTFNGSTSSDPLSLYGRAGSDILIGGSANDRLYGDNGTNTGDILNGLGGDDYLYGGTNTGGWAERDQFVFDADWGADRIFDFADNGFEKINFVLVPGITQRSDLTITTGAGYALIRYHDIAGNWDASIRVDGVTAADLQNNDFVF